MKRAILALSALSVLMVAVLAVLIAIELIAKNLINTPAIGLNSNQNSKVVNAPFTPAPQVLLQGEYLTKVGNCASCHTARGGAAYAGGKPIATPFGTVYTSNITPDMVNGIGAWSADAFYRAMHEGRSADGHLLTPAFPYPNFTHVSRSDSDAIYAYFMHSIAPVAQANRAHALAFPYNSQIALAVWRLIFFEKNTSPKNGADVDRGAYLVRGLGHCSACHAQRNAWGANLNQTQLSGSMMPMQDWYAPSLIDARQAGVAQWSLLDAVKLLKTGINAHASVQGPMAEVVAGSTQFWTDADLQSAAIYLKSLPQSDPILDVSSPKLDSEAVVAQAHSRGLDVYKQHCASCHGEQGQGAKMDNDTAWPALAGNRAVTMRNASNVVRIILTGGFAPSTAGNPRPLGMPPFVHVLNEKDIAAVTSYVRSAWGNRASAVDEAEVLRQRQGVSP